MIEWLWTSAGGSMAASVRMNGRSGVMLSTLVGMRPWSLFPSVSDSNRPRSDSVRVLGMRTRRDDIRPIQLPATKLPR